MMDHHYLPRLQGLAGTGRFVTHTGKTLDHLITTHPINVDQAEQLSRYMNLLSNINYTGYIHATQNCKMMEHLGTILQSSPLPAAGLTCDFSNDAAFVTRR